MPNPEAKTVFLSAENLTPILNTSNQKVSSTSPRIAIPFVFTPENPGYNFTDQYGKSKKGYTFSTGVGDHTESTSFFTTTDEKPVLIITPIPSDKKPLAEEQYKNLLSEIAYRYNEVKRISIDPLTLSPTEGIDYNGFKAIRSILENQFKITDFYNSTQAYVDSKLIREDGNNFSYRRKEEEHKAIIVEGNFTLTGGEIGKNQHFPNGALLILNSNGQIRGIDLETAKSTYTNVDLGSSYNAIDLLEKPSTRISYTRPLPPARFTANIYY